MVDVLLCNEVDLTIQEPQLVFPNLDAAAGQPATQAIGDIVSFGIWEDITAMPNKPAALWRLSKLVFIDSLLTGRQMWLGGAHIKNIISMQTGLYTVLPSNVIPQATFLWTLFGIHATTNISLVLLLNHGICRQIKAMLQAYCNLAAANLKDRLFAHH